MVCTRCHRQLTRPPVYVAGMSLGPRCAQLVAGSKPRRARTSAPDARQADLFAAEARP